ncbi:long-chain-fatty-acid--CoA ligase [Desulforhabdus amnigena]|jgi:O-succinylbenzoate-CoA ligase|uniref:Acyl-CoA synthetase n=1 Tax=Desulforhabdus amnigena TaxID=40218 RepID=A0A9W6FT63_9BACT|nr:long-chain-fatty-acid--CoA ligase [Desulforhabdus amnigena]NLJ29648.1 long-chain-fatty-acid--CoA ligase [Deltaproteobacteria bacterium]GLI33080.1 acyl-CoA synthetase [Desulforhabdus amnigena]
MYTLGDIPRCSARSFPTRTAISFEGTSLTYAELNQRVNRLCNSLRVQGIGKEDRLAVLSENTYKYLEIYFAAGKLGISVTPLNFRLADPEIIHIINDSESTVLFAGDGYEERAMQMAGSLPGIRQWIAMDNRAAGFDFYEDLLASASVDEPESDTNEEDMAILMYTGGTTGLPKGVMMTHRALVTGFISTALTFSFSKQDITCFVLPLFHVSFWPAFAHLLVGGKVVIMRRPEVAGVLELIQDQRCTHINAVPTLYNWMLQLVHQGAYDLSSLRIMTYAGSPFPPELLKKCIERFGPIFMQAYGMTECIGGTSLSMEDHCLEGERSRLLASAGRPIIGVDVAVTGTDDKPLPPGEIGEIILRGKCVMKGYWKNPDLTAETLRGGWYHTGDMGYLDKDGYLFLVDRKADMIVTGGENVYPKEVEDVLYQHPAVSMAAVVSAPDEKWGERVQAVVVLKPDQKVNEEELIAHCKSLLAGYKCPKAIDFRDSLPTTAVGKILRKDIKKTFWQGYERTIN